MSISWILEIWPLFSAACFAFIITYLVGFLFSIPIIGEKKLPSFVSVFFKLGLGYLIIPMAYSIYFTGGYTIFTGMVLLSLIVGYLNRDEWEFSKIRLKIEIKNLIIGILVLFGLVSFQCWRYGFFDEIYFHSSMRDNGIYVTIGEYLKITGIETSSPWYQLISDSADGIAKVYHYEDFWFLAMVLDILPERPLDVFNFIFSPVLGILQFYGGLALIIALSKTERVTFWGIILSSGCVIFNMYVPFPWAQWSLDLQINIMQFPKIAAVPILVPFAIVARKFKIPYIDCLAFGFIIITDPLFMPTILGAAFTFYLIRFYFIRNKEDLYGIALLIIAAMFFFLFHLVFGSLDNSSSFNYIRGNETYMYSFIKNLTASFLRHFIFFFSVYIALVFFIIRNKFLKLFEKEVLGIFLFILFYGSLVRSIMSNNFEGFQFDILLQTTIGAFLILCCICILWRLSLEYKHCRKVPITLLLVLVSHFCFGLYSTYYANKTKNIYTEKSFVREAQFALADKNKIGAAIQNKSKYASNEFNHTESIEADPRICFFCNFLKHIGPGYWANQINIPSSLKAIKYKERTKAIELSPFYCFIQKLKKEGKYTNFEDAQVSFINMYGVDFVVVEKDAELPEKISSCVLKRIKDPLSGTTLFLLNQHCK